MGSQSGVIGPVPRAGAGFSAGVRVLLTCGERGCPGEMLRPITTFMSMGKASECSDSLESREC